MTVVGRPTVTSALMWTRGKARHDGGYIVLEEPEEYSLYSNTNMIFDLADVKGIDACVAFASRYGLLRHASPSEGLREPVTDWLEQAATIYVLLQIAWFYRKATRDGDAAAIQELREHFYPKLIRPLFEFEAQDDSDLLLHASLALAFYVNQGMDGTQHRISTDAEWDDSTHGGFRNVIAPPTLLASIYHQFGTLLMQGVEVRHCPECGRVFLPSDSRQRYCTPACSQRARFKRFKEKREAATVDSGHAGGDNRRQADPLPASGANTNSSEPG